MQVADLFGMLAFTTEKMNKVGIFLSERMACDLYCFEPDQTQKPHTHDSNDKVYVVLEGRGLFTIAGEQREITAGQAVWAPAGQEHGVLNPGRERLICLVAMSPAPEKR